MFRAVAVLGLALLIEQVAATQADRFSLPDDDRVRAAREFVRRNEGATLNDQVRLCEIPAPTFSERARAQVVRDLLRTAGLTGARFDSVGNVVAERRGRAARPNVVLSAHLDTVFAEGTPVKVTSHQQTGQGTVLRGPGVGDNCRGLAVLVAIARALNAAALQTEGSITFVATVAEEGVGDLRGARTLLASTLQGRVDQFVAIDGSGFLVTNVGVGSRRYRVTYRGPGGHPYANFDRPNPAQALGRAIAAIADFDVPSKPRTTVNVGRIGGGTAVNAIPAESWMEIDLRSQEPTALDVLDRRVREVVERAATNETGRATGSNRITVSMERIGDRPAGRTPERSVIVQTALEVSSKMGIDASLAAGSTDANAAMQLNIPAIAIGGGGQGMNTHSLEESFDTTGSVRGTERALLVALALSRSQ